MANRNSGENGPRPEVMPSHRGKIKKKRRTSNTTGSSVLSLGSGEDSAFKEKVKGWRRGAEELLYG